MRYDVPMADTRTIAGRIDHTILQAEADSPAVKRAVDEAIAHGFAAVCVNGAWTDRVREALGDSGVTTCTAVGFPLGANDAAIKRMEAMHAAERGAQEIDFVAHLPDLLDADVPAATDHFRAIAEAARQVAPGLVVKVIIESALLMHTDDTALAERRIACACEAAHAAGLDFVKTSTGFHPAGGASVEAVRLMRKYALATMRIKASGGIRTRDQAIAMLEAGADRLGCSSSVAIVNR